MNGGFTPIVVRAAARNIVPLAGVLVLHWSTGNVLILYLLETLLSMAVIAAGLAASLAPAPDDEGVGDLIVSVVMRFFGRREPTPRQAQAARPRAAR